MSHLGITHPAQLPPQLCYPRKEQKAKKSSIHIHCFLFKEKNQKRIRMKRIIRSRSRSSKRRKKGRKRSIGRKSRCKWRVKRAEGWSRSVKSDPFDIVLQIMGHIKESFFKHEKKFRIKLQNSRQLMQAGNALQRPWKNLRKVDSSIDGCCRCPMWRQSTSGWPCACSLCSLPCWSTLLSILSLVNIRNSFDFEEGRGATAWWA